VHPPATRLRQGDHEKYPIGRFGELEEIVGVSINLASDNSKFMMVELKLIDGGGNAQRLKRYRRIAALPRQEDWPVGMLMPTG
jgi:hypothetical protein